MSPDALLEFGIHPERGFLPEPDPAEKLPEELSFLDEYAKELPQWMERGRVREELDRLWPLKGKHYLLLEDIRLRRRALMLYCFFASAYVFEKGKESSARIPTGIAMPLSTLAWWLDVPPILAYQSYALANWRRKDPNGPLVVENMENLVNFVTIPDEWGFILPHVEINAKAATAMRTAFPLMEAVEKGASDLVEAYLWEIGYSVGAMVATLAKIRKYCDPSVYYREVRPYIQKFVNVIYLGVKKYGGEPQSFNGESGAQDSNLPSLDALLGIRHRAPEDNEELKRFLWFLEEAQKYMPVGHRRFIKTLRENSRVREFVLRSNPRVKEAYNFGVERIADFRHGHLGLAIDYIHKPMPQETLGTFGTPFMKWLNWLREETLSHKIA
ncbi:MAG: hypothetical protein WAP51_04820 [Candidatus Sungiibacteriota bacterium]